MRRKYQVTVECSDSTKREIITYAVDAAHAVNKATKLVRKSGVKPLQTYAQDITDKENLD